MTHNYSYVTILGVLELVIIQNVHILSVTVTRHSRMNAANSLIYAYLHFEFI